MRPLLLLAVYSIFILPACRPAEGRKLHAEPRADTMQMVSEGKVFMRRDGKLFGLPPIADIYQPAGIDTVPFPFLSASQVTALQRQLELLEKSGGPKNRRIGNLTVDEGQLRESIRILLQWQHTFPQGLHHYLEAWQIRGEDKRGNVLFTGYYTPVIPVRKERSPSFEYPVYDRPRNWQGPYPTRREIEAGNAFKGMGLELAFARDPLDIYFMQLQGSGFVEYPDGKRKYFAYNGTNRHPFRSVESLIRKHALGENALLSPNGMKAFFKKNPHLVDSLMHRNPSYTFFSPSNRAPEGSGGVPLSGMISVAADPRYIPPGSCLLAALPEYDPVSRSVRHRYALLLAQDKGGAIRGPGRVDFYTGIGADAGKKASQIRHYGRLWLLLPRKMTLPPFLPDKPVM